jgi:hypothetical protein
VLLRPSLGLKVSKTSSRAVVVVLCVAIHTQSTTCRSAGGHQLLSQLCCMWHFGQVVACDCSNVCSCTRLRPLAGSLAPAANTYIAKQLLLCGAAKHTLCDEVFGKPLAATVAAAAAAAELAAAPVQQLCTCAQCTLWEVCEKH